MTDNEFLLQDRLQKIRQIINKYGEENFYIAFSGGKDSTVLSVLVDMALPDNKIPRVFINTGIELNMIRDFVIDMQKTDERIVIIQPSIPIKPMLERDGYPFKNKRHSHIVERYQRKGMESQSVRAYIGIENQTNGKPVFRACPKILRYQFKENMPFKISDKCCLNLKEKPMEKWAKDNNRPYGIVGIRREEGERRQNAQCLTFKSKKLWHFQPLSPVNKGWETWFIDRYGIEICAIYKEPYNFDRTGCKGCPFARYLQNELDTLEQFFPSERKQAEIIWKPVYDEYRRIGYRLKKQYEHQMTIDEWFKEREVKE